MLIQKAKDKYLGRNGYKKMNCAEATFDVLKEKFNLDDSIDIFKNCGGGRAPNGLCGAVYAGKRALEKIEKEKIEEFEKYLKETAGSLNCKEIRALKKLNCLECIEKTINYIDKH